MSYLNDPYRLTLFLSATIIVIMAGCLLGFTVPKDSRLKSYRIARRLLACAYLVLAVAGFGELIGMEEEKVTKLVMSLTLIIASLQAFFFTYAIITLIDMRYLTIRVLKRQLIPISVLSVALLVVLGHAPSGIFRIVFYTMLVCYCTQLAYYIKLFSSQHEQYKRLTDKCFTQDESKRLRWIHSSFYMALGIGVLTIGSIFVSQNLYIVYTVIYTLFYVYFAMKYVSYISIFHIFAPVVSAVEPDNKQTVRDEDLSATVLKWVEQKKFTSGSVTLDKLAIELNTNRTYLSTFINTQMGCSFKAWISRLRIEEAKRLLVEQASMPVSAIGEAVGIADKSSFFRQFAKLTGATPGEYRQQTLKNN